VLGENRVALAREPVLEESYVSDKHHVPFPEDADEPSATMANGDDGAPKSADQTDSYTMVDPRYREVYFRFYKETYRAGVLDRKTKELVAIAASLAAKCQGCLEGHIRKAIKSGATREEISESIAIAMGVNAAAVVDLTDIAAENMGVKLY